MYRLYFLSILLLCSFILMGQDAEPDSLRADFRTMNINIIDPGLNTGVIRSGLRRISEGKVRAGLSEMACGLQLLYEKDSAERALSYHDLEFYTLLQEFEEGIVSAPNEEALIRFFVYLAMGNLDMETAIGPIYRKKQADPFYLRLLLLSYFLKNEAGPMTDHLHAYLETDPGSLPATSLMGAVEFSMGHFERTIMWFSKAVELSPQYAYGYMMRGISYAELEMKMEAEADIRESLRLYPENGLAYYQLGIINQQEERYEEAIACFRHILDQPTVAAEACNNIGVNYDKLGMADSAIYYLEKALELEPDAPMTYMNLGYIYYDKEEYSVASYLISKALELDSEYLPGLRAAAGVHMKIKDYDAALAYLRQAILLDSMNPVLFRMAASCYLDVEQTREALDCLEKALALDPSDDVSWTNLAWTYYLEGDFQKCLEYSQKAYELDPSAYIAKYNAALAVLRLGRIEESYEMYRSFYHESPDFDISGSAGDLQDLVEQKIMVREARYILKNILNVN